MLFLDWHAPVPMLLSMGTLPRSYKKLDGCYYHLTNMISIVSDPSLSWPSKGRLSPVCCLDQLGLAAHDDLNFVVGKLAIFCSVVMFQLGRHGIEQAAFASLAISR